MDHNDAFRTRTKNTLSSMNHVLSKILSCLSIHEAVRSFRPCGHRGKRLVEGRCMEHPWVRKNVEIGASAMGFLSAHNGRGFQALARERPNSRQWAHLCPPSPEGEASALDYHCRNRHKICDECRTSLKFKIRHQQNKVSNSRISPLYTYCSTCFDEKVGIFSELRDRDRIFPSQLKYTSSYNFLPLYSHKMRGLCGSSRGPAHTNRAPDLGDWWLPFLRLVVVVIYGRCFCAERISTSL